MRAWVLKAYAAARKAVLAYPGGTTAVLGIVVALAAKFGLDVTVTELTAIFGVFIVVAGVFVHMTTVAKPGQAVKPKPLHVSTPPRIT